MGWGSRYLCITDGTLEEPSEGATDWVMDLNIKGAAYWELHSSAPLIYKDAEDASTSGVHTTITLSGRYVEEFLPKMGVYFCATKRGWGRGYTID